MDHIIELTGSSNNLMQIKKTGGAYIYVNLNKEFEVIPTGVAYKIGDYEYVYNEYWDGSQWYAASNQNGWGVHVLDTGKTNYGPILESINGQPVNTLNKTFAGCTALIIAPTIPNNIIKMNDAFNGCSALTTVTRIPSNVKNMDRTFYKCKSLKR